MTLKNVPLPKPKKTKRKPPTPKRGKVSAKSALERAKEAKKQAQRAMTMAEKKIRVLEKVENPSTAAENTLVEEGDVDFLPKTAREAFEESGEVAFRPNEGPQTEFLSSVEREVLYGGAAGGGKSIGILVDPLRYCHIEAFRGILFRRTNDALRELIQKSKELYTKAFPGAKWSEQKSTWTFPSGAQIWFTYLDRDDDVIRYQGQAFAWVGFDELTQWPTSYPWDYMRSRLRVSSEYSKVLPLSMRATTNPGGPGSWWVRKMFIDPAPWNTPFPATDIETGTVLRGRDGQPLFNRRFIPARLQDNPYLFEDGQYEANLMSLPESVRRQLLEGDWDVVEGAAFPEFSRKIHTCEPFPIPSGWERFRAADWGYSSPACVLWFAIDWDGTLYVYRELYTKGLNAEDFAKKVLEMEEKDRVRYGVLDSSTWARRGDVGPSIAETMIKAGCRWQPSDRSPNSRIQGKLQVHKRLALRETGEFDEKGEPIKRPGLIFFNNCVNLIRTLPLLPLDKNRVEDVDTDAEDHAYDALRYGVASRPMNPRSKFSDTMRANTYIPADPVFGY